MNDFYITNEMIGTNDIIIDPLRQRNVESRNAQYNKIMREFNPMLVNDLKIALIDDKYYCFDGQMTRKVLIAKNGGKHLPVRCKVYHGLTLKDIGFCFAEQNGTVSVVRPSDKIRVRMNDGVEPETSFVKAVESCGLKIAWEGRSKDYYINAVSCAFDWYKKIGESDFKFAMNLINAAWNGDHYGLSRQMICGVCEFVKAYGVSIRFDAFRKQLSKVTPLELITSANVDKSSGHRKYAVQILLAYNHGLKTGRLPFSI